MYRETTEWSSHSPYFTKVTTKKKVCSNALFFNVGEAGDGAAPTVGVLGAPTNGTLGAAGDTNRPYKWIDLQRPP
jgi:hypothetical protein